MMAAVSPSGEFGGRVSVRQRWVGFRCMNEDREHSSRLGTAADEINIRKGK